MKRGVFISITYISRRGESINFEVIKVNIGKQHYNLPVRMENQGAGHRVSRISVLMNCRSVSDIVYSYLQPTHNKIFQRLTNIYYSKFNEEFAPGLLKLYHETCGHMNLYIENLLAEETVVTHGIRFFRWMNREEMLRSSEIADVGFEDNNSAYFNSTSVVVGGRREKYYRMSSRANLRNFAGIDYDIEINI